MKKVLITNGLFNRKEYIRNMGRETLLISPFSKHFSWWKDWKEIKLLNIDNIANFKSFKGLVVIEDCHLISKQAYLKLVPLLASNDVIFFSYAITERTIQEFREIFNIEPEIEDVSALIDNYELKDYKITIHECSLDNTRKIHGEAELEFYNKFNELREIQLEIGEVTYTTELKLNSILSNSYGKLNKINELLEQFKEEKIIVISSVIKGINRLHCETFNVYNKDKSLIEKFNSNQIKQLAFNHFPKKEIKNVNRIILNLIDCNPEILANLIMECYKFNFCNSFGEVRVEIISSNTVYEKCKLKQVLEMFDGDKIKWK